MTLVDDTAWSFVDLVGTPFTFPGSRLLVMRDGDALTVSRAEYEVPLAECVVVERLRVLDSAGAMMPVSLVRPDRIEFGDGVVSLVFAGRDELSMGGEIGAQWALSYRLPGSDVDEIVAPTTRLMAVHLGDGAAPRATAEPHDAHARNSRMVWDEWMGRCPVVRADLQAMANQCWWVLGANIVTLPQLGDARAVVPSKIGYVGLWQWDAYFIAVGLRHGAPELAAQQLDLAFRFPTADGQLPDVVHDDGVLASSDDLPAQDRETLRRAGSSIADPTKPVPLTKPPLAAWALRKVLEFYHDEAWAAGAWETVARSQAWWFDHSDLDHNGMPEYSHPYSSGLDDSPIFDHELPVASPDLASYLIVQDEELARHFQEIGAVERATFHRQRADHTTALLLATWNEAVGYFPAEAAGRALSDYTAVSLIPLLTGRLPADVASRLAAALSDPGAFATRYGIPTVAVSDPEFDPDHMWRGPVWVNINALIAEGLAKSGFPERARQFAESTVALVCQGGGPHEYFNPLTGQRAPRATTSFGWSAALFIDLAVALSV